MSILARAIPHFAQSARRIPAVFQSNVKYNVDMAKKTAILLIADGSEEMEAVITTDVLRRAGVRFLFLKQCLTLNNKYALSIRTNVPAKLSIECCAA